MECPISLCNGFIYLTSHCLLLMQCNVLCWKTVVDVNCQLLFCIALSYTWIAMPKTCSVAGCKTNYQKKENSKTTMITPGAVFGFPDAVKKSDLLKKWVRFCNQKLAFEITENSGICEKHTLIRDSSSMVQGNGLYGVEKIHFALFMLWKRISHRRYYPIYILYDSVHLVKNIRTQ